MTYWKKWNGLLGYDASITSNKRRSASSRLLSVDDELTRQQRKQLIANARDLQQNYSVAAWAIRQHLDYVTSFTFQADTGDDGLNRDIEGLMKWYSRPLHCDVASRHSLDRIIRIAESRCVLDGDVGLLKVNTGHLQGIEGDRIRDPDKADETWKHGVKTTKGGRALRYAIHKRTRRNFEFERTVLASNFFHLGYFERFDQIRGVAPLATAINSFRDTYEAIDLALAKSKVASLFALAIYSESGEGSGDHEDDGEGGYDVDFGKGPIKLELDGDDRAEFLESKTPSTEMQAFTQLVISAALKSIDIPFSFFDESFTNFNGSRMAGMHYERSCKSKRSRLKELLDRITLWRLAMFIRDGALRLPSGMSLGQVGWDWIHAGTPWWDPAKEIKADIMAIEAGLTTRTQVIRERHGREFRDVIDKLAEEEAYIEDKGVTVGTSVAAAQIEPEEREEDEA